MLDSLSIYTTAVAGAGGSRIRKDFVVEFIGMHYADLIPSFTTMNNIRSAQRARSRALRNRPRTLFYIIPI